MSQGTNAVALSSLPCSLALENQPLAAVDRLLAAASNDARGIEMQLFNLRTILVEALCKHPRGSDRLLDVLKLPGPALPAAEMQQALQALAASPDRLPDAWKLAEQMYSNNWEGNGAVVGTLWSAALKAGSRGESVVSSIVHAAACFPPSIVARMLVATWSAAESCRVLHHQLASVLVFQLVVDADLVGTDWFEKAQQALMTLPNQPPDASFIMPRLFNLLYEGWQDRQPRSIQPWAMEEVIPLLAGISAEVAHGKETSSVQIFGQQLVQSLLQGGHGQYVAEEYTRLVSFTGVQLGSTEQAQLLRQAGPAKALPLLMAEVELKGVRASDQGLLQALLESASKGSSDCAVLAAASQLLSSPSITASAGLCTSALQAAARNAGSAAHSALELAQAAFKRAVQIGVQPSSQAAVACIKLATQDRTAAQWLEVVKESLTQAAAAPWYDALLLYASEQHRKAQQGAALVLMSAMSALLSAAASQQVELEVETLLSIVATGLSDSAGGSAGENAQLAVQAARIAQQQDLLSKVLTRLNPGQRQALSSALVDAKEWGLALSTSQEPRVLSQVLEASAGQQLPGSALTAALDAAVTADCPDLTLAFLEAHILPASDLQGSALLSVLGGQPGLVRLCKHQLRGGSSTGQAMQAQGQQQQNAVVQLVQKVVAGNSAPFNKDTWQAILDAMVSAVATQQLSVSGEKGTEDILALCRLASTNPHRATGTWHLYAAAQLAAAPQCVSSAARCLQVSKRGRHTFCPQAATHAVSACMLLLVLL
jgi:hypothetical protein